MLGTLGMVVGGGGVCAERDVTQEGTNMTKGDGVGGGRWVKKGNFSVLLKETLMKSVTFSAAGNADVNLGSETFLKLIEKTLDKHAPLKKTSRKKEKDKMKPWVTRGIRHLIEITHKLYKQFIKSKNNQTRQIKQATFKKYRNKITPRISR